MPALLLTILFPYFIIIIGGVLAVIFFILTFMKESKGHHDEHEQGHGH